MSARDGFVPIEGNGSARKEWFEEDSTEIADGYHERCVADTAEEAAWKDADIECYDGEFDAGI